MFDLKEAARAGVLVAAHRGSWMGNVPCNTMMSFEAALMEGADIIELDISRSAEGTLYIFHPGKEELFLRSLRMIAEMRDAEVEALRLINTDGAETQYAVPRFDDVLEALKGRCFINVDKFPHYPQEIIAAVRRHGMVDQVLVKTNQEEKYYRLMEELAPDFAYMTFAYDVDRDSAQLVRRPLHYCGTEALFKTESSSFATAAYHEWMHSMGLLTWANAIVFNYQTVHAAGHTDDLYTLHRADEGWGHLADLGFNMIQTDWVGPCVRYLEARGCRPASAQKQASE